jgi:hypothetical protein
MPKKNTVTIEIAIDEGAPLRCRGASEAVLFRPTSPVPNLIKRYRSRAGQRLNKADFDQSKELL